MELRNYQAEIIDEALASLMFGSTNIVIDSPPACVPGNTEFLTPNGWKRIDEFNHYDLVCQWNQNGETSFVKPIAYIKQECNNDFINIETNGINLTVSENHKMPYLTNKGRRSAKPSEKEAKDLIKIGEISIPRNFDCPVKQNKIDFSIDEMKVLIMQSADGNIMNFKKSDTIRINLKKERKKERARELLKNANIEYKERIVKETGYSVFTYKFKCPLKDLSFLYLLTKAQLCSLSYDIIFWDGSNPNKDRKNYNGAVFHGNKRDVDAAQYALSIVTGNYVSINKDKREYVSNDIYSCRISTKPKSFIKTRRNDGPEAAKITYVKSEDGFHYCFETESGFWLMRQNNQIYPTGNSGKSLIIAETARRLALEGKKVVISLTISALVDQIAKHLDLLNTDYSILKAGRESEFDDKKLIQVCQAHTLHARLAKLDHVKANVYMQDEVHREYQTQRTRDILKHLEIDARIGYSGTPYDEAGFLLADCELLRTTTAIDLQNQGFLCPIKYFVPKWAESIDFSNLKKSGNDYSEKDLNTIINTDNHLRLAVESMNQMNAKNKKTMVFCSGIEQAEKFTEMLKKEGYNAFAYHSKMDKKESEKILQAYINNTNYVPKINEDDQPTLFEQSTSHLSGSKVTCLVSINKLGIGFDCPDTVLGVQLRPTKIKSLFIQQVMRMSRQYKPMDSVLDELSDKINCKIAFIASKEEYVDEIKEQLLEKRISNIDVLKDDSDILQYDIVKYNIKPNKKFSEYLDLGQTLSNHGFHTDVYNPPKRTGDKNTDYENLAEANRNNLEDLAATLTNELEEITFNTYNTKIEKIKASLQKNLYDLSVKELAAAFDISKDHKEIITIATIIYTYKYGRPVSKTGYEYDYKPENFWSKSTFGDNEDFHVHYSMDEYFKMYPEMKSQWIKSLRTRCRNIIKEGKKLFSITGFIKYLAEKYEEENAILEPTVNNNRPYESGSVSTSGYGSSMKHTGEYEVIYEDDLEEIPF